MRYLGIAFCLAALLFVSQVQIFVDRVPQLSAVIASVVVELTNDERTAEELGTLRVSDALTAAAARKATDMAEKGYFAHTSPEGVTPWHWFKESGYTFVYAGENLAIDFEESPDVVRAWMESPSHRANIVGTQFTEIGVAVAQGEYEGRPATFVVQLFGTPRPEPSKVNLEGSGVKSDFTQEPTKVALATTLAGEPPTEVEVLGQTAGAILETTKVPWWHKWLNYFF